MPQLPAFTAIHDVPAYWAAQRPDAICLYDTAGVVRYGELWARVIAMADWLAAQGVDAGDRVLVSAENCVEAVAVLFACSVRGAWPIVVNARLSPRELTVITDHAQPALRLYTVRVSDAAQAHADTAGAQPVPLADFAGLRFARPDVAPERETGEHQRAVAALIYTSGTTGPPRA